MSETTLKCPSCGHAFPLTDALAAQLRGEVEAALLERHRTQLQALSDRAAQAEAREVQAQRRALELQQAQTLAIERAKVELEAKLRTEAQAQLAAMQAQLEAAQAAELKLRQQAEAVAARERQLDLEVARRLDEKRRDWEAQVRQLAVEEQRLKLQEKDKTIEDLKRLLEEARRKSEQGSQELQGEVLELDIQAALAAQFPRDVIRPIPKGANGADLVQEVRDAALAPCGLIVWETKNTKHWQPAWIGKLKEDQRACGAAIAVLVTAALPAQARAGFAFVDGVWVASLAAWPALAFALREQLLAVAFARNAATGMSAKMEALYNYLAGDAFRHRVEAIVEAFSAMKSELERERRAMQRIWKERETQLERVLAATAGMYGELRGTIGASMPAIAALELDTGPSLGAPS